MVQANVSLFLLKEGKQTMTIQRMTLGYDDLVLRIEIAETTLPYLSLIRNAIKSDGILRLDVIYLMLGGDFEKIANAIVGEHDSDFWKIDSLKFRLHDADLPEDKNALLLIADNTDQVVESGVFEYVLYKVNDLEKVVSVEYTVAQTTVI